MIPWRDLKVCFFWVQHGKRQALSEAQAAARPPPCTAADVMVLPVSLADGNSVWDLRKAGVSHSVGAQDSPPIPNTIYSK